MTDVLAYTVPYGIIGTLVDRLYLCAYMTRFLRRRAEVLRTMAEAGAPVPNHGDHR
jgi:hypothetical protein